jgi:hypothetical protein
MSLEGLRRPLRLLPSINFADGLLPTTNHLIWRSG